MLLMLSLRLPLQPPNVKRRATEPVFAAPNVKRRGPDAADDLAEVAFAATKCKTKGP